MEHDNIYSHYLLFHKTEEWGFYNDYLNFKKKKYEKYNKENYSIQPQKHH
jgi:hypothetical protein